MTMIKSEKFAKLTQSWLWNEIARNCQHMLSGSLTSCQSWSIRHLYFSLTSASSQFKTKILFQLSTTFSRMKNWFEISHDPNYRHRNIRDTKFFSSRFHSNFEKLVIFNLLKSFRKARWRFLKAWIKFHRELFWLLKYLNILIKNVS